MKTLTPAKTVALAALAATLALPAAQAKPTAPVKRASAQTLAAARQQYQAALKLLTDSRKSSARAAVTLPLTGPQSDLVSINAPGMSVLMAIALMFQNDHRSYVVEPGVSGTVFLKMDDVPLEKALNTLVGANSEPLSWTVLDGVYHIRPRTLHAGEIRLFNPPRQVQPRQVQLKFEWVASAGAAPNKSMDTLTIIAEEGRRTQASSQHLRDGAGRQETITVLARLEAGGMVTLDITERSDTTARPGETVSNSSQTVVSVKDGETGAVGGLTLGSQKVGQGTQLLLFVTPSIIRAADGGPSAALPSSTQFGGAGSPFTVPPPGVTK